MRKYVCVFAVFFILPVMAFPQAKVINTIAGGPETAGYSGDGGPATAALLYDPSDVALDASGNLYIADFINNVIRKVDTNGIISTIAGTGLGAGTVSGAGGGYTGNGGPATAAELNGPFALAIDTVGNVFFADGYNHVVRKITVATGIISLVAGNNTVGYFGDGYPATTAQIDNPVGLVFDKQGNLYIADDHNHVVRKVSTTDTITTYAGNHINGYSGDGGQATAASMGDPIGLAMDTAGNLYIADTSNVVRKVSKFGIISTFAGSLTAGYSGDGGPATAATLRSPERVTVDDSNNVYISDYYNNVIRKVDASGNISTFAGDGTGAGSPTTPEYGGDGGPATAAQLFLPEGVAITRAGNMYIADRGNDIIRFIGPPDTVNNEGVHNLNNHGSPVLSVYPNPVASNYFTTVLYSGINEAVAITITNILGETVKKMNAATNKQVSIYLNQPAGIYFLSATTSHGNWNKQIAVE